MSTKSSPSDFSLFSLFTAGLACMVPLASAYTKPVGSSPKGNPISEPGLNSIVPVGAPFSVTWNQNAPDSCPDSTVTLVLLKGPATNAVPQYAIAEKVKNTGTYAWTPSKDLAPGQTGYGIQLICDSNGQYQYTTQFGISNPNYKASGSISSSSVAASTTAKASISSAAEDSANSTLTASAVYTTEIVTDYTTYCPYSTEFSMFNKTYTASSATTLTISATLTKTLSSTAGPITGSANGTSVAPASLSMVPSSGYLPGNASIVHPTGSITVPASLKTTLATATGSPIVSTSSASGSAVAPAQTGAAAHMATSLAGLVVAAGVAVFAL